MVTAMGTAQLRRRKPIRSDWRGQEQPLRLPCLPSSELVKDLVEVWCGYSSSSCRQRRLRLYTTPLVSAPLVDRTQ